ncbi:MAG: hypothetical protein KGK01_13880 [Bradyrhizobium sp.]|nr:hypothetical protein [Bradyrhizobium sp.]MDE2468193.1 hypothetical protein [Bradyrhizobium sp.]
MQKCAGRRKAGAPPHALKENGGAGDQDEAAPPETADAAVTDEDSTRLAGAELAVDELCASSSACIVAGDIREAVLNPVAGPVFAAAEAGLETLNGPACSKPEPETPDGAGEDADVINDRTASNAVDAAPKANSMIKLQYAPRQAAYVVHASAVPGQKSGKEAAF